MPILPENLGIRFESDLVLETKTVLVYRYEVFHQTWVPDTVIEEAMIWQVVAANSQFGSADAALQSRLASKLREARDRYRGIGTIGYSLHELDLIWQHWTFTQLADGRLSASHPLLGTFTGQAENTPEGRTTALLGLVPGPPAWAWADSPGPGQLRVKCVAVTGADHYNVYHDGGGGTFDLLGSVPDAGLNSLSVEPGEYTVRLAAVAANGRIGILSIPVAVTVGGLDAPAMDEIELRAMSEEEPETEPEPELTRGDRFVRWLWGPERYDKTT